MLIVGKEIDHSLVIAKSSDFSKFSFQVATYLGLMVPGLPVNLITRLLLSFRNLLKNLFLCIFATAGSSAAERAGCGSDSEHG